MSKTDFRGKDTKAFIANIGLVVMEIIGLSFSVSNRGIQILAYYTQISNLITLIGSVVFLFRPESKISSAFRFLSTVMLTMTMLVTVFVLIPMGADAKMMLLGNSQIFHHVLCPVVSLISYFCWEKNEHEPLLLPLIVTLLYGVPMLILNGLELFEGPYPFFRVNQQGAFATALWIIALLLFVFGIEISIRRIRNMIQKNSN